MKRTDECKTGAAEMRFLRPVSWHKLQDQIRNTEQRQHLNIYSVNDKVEGRRSGWYQYSMKMNKIEAFPNRF
jgi:hypothetical protein